MADAPRIDDLEQLLHDDQIDLIVTAAVPNRRLPIAVEATALPQAHTFEAMRLAAEAQQHAPNEVLPADSRAEQERP